MGLSRNVAWCQVKRWVAVGEPGGRDVKRTVSIEASDPTHSRDREEETDEPSGMNATRLPGSAKGDERQEGEERHSLAVIGQRQHTLKQHLFRFSMQVFSCHPQCIKPRASNAPHGRIAPAR